MDVSQDSAWCHVHRSSRVKADVMSKFVVEEVFMLLFIFVGFKVS